VVLAILTTHLAGAFASHRARFRVPTGRDLAYCLAWAAQETSYDLRPAAAELGWTPRVAIADGLGD